MSDVRMLVFLIRANGMKGLNSINTNDAAEDIGLFEVDIDELCGLAFDVIDRPLNMNWL